MIDSTPMLDRIALLSNRIADLGNLSARNRVTEQSATIPILQPTTTQFTTALSTDSSLRYLLKEIQVIHAQLQRIHQELGTITGIGPELCWQLVQWHLKQCVREVRELLQFFQVQYHAPQHVELNLTIPATSLEQIQKRKKHLDKLYERAITIGVLKDKLINVMNSLYLGEKITEDTLTDLMHQITTSEMTRVSTLAENSAYANATEKYTDKLPDLILFVATHAMNRTIVLQHVLSSTFCSDVVREQILISSLIMDVGMIQSGKHLFTANGPLNDQQLADLQKHVIRSVEIANTCLPGKYRQVPELIRNHHERIDGSGYPEGSIEKQLTTESELLGIVDTYTALRENRPYRKAKPANIALNEMNLLAEAGHFRYQTMQSLNKLGQYPAGTIVELSSGEIGYVHANLTTDQRQMVKPIVQILLDLHKQPLTWHKQIDFSKNRDIQITRILAQGQAFRYLADTTFEWALLS
ncbi:MAG: HD domain-containing phosphohydrolase [Zavarzinella sp.]